MNITKAIIHSLANDAQTIVYSSQPLNLNNNQAVERYLERLIKGIVSSVSVSKTNLGINAGAQAYVGQTFNFYEASMTLAKDWFDHLKVSEPGKPCNLVVVQADHDDTSFLCVFEVRNKDGYFKHIENSSGLETVIHYNQGILPSTFSSVHGAFVLDLTTAALRVRYRSANRDFLENLLDCTMIANDKESFQVVDGLINHFSESRNEDVLTNTIKARAVITDNLELFDDIQPAQILKEVFPNLDDKEKDVMDASFKANHVRDYINLKTVNRSSMIRRHRIMTEVGIEIVLPLDQVDITHRVILSEDETGNTTITLKNVGKILHD